MIPNVTSEASKSLMRRCRFRPQHHYCQCWMTGDLIISMGFSIFGKAHGESLWLVANLGGAPGLTQGEELTCALAPRIPQEKLLFLLTPVVWENCPGRVDIPFPGGWEMTVLYAGEASCLSCGGEDLISPVTSHLLVEKILSPLSLPDNPLGLRSWGESSCWDPHFLVGAGKESSGKR